MVLLELFICYLVFFFFKQKTAYDVRISDWSSDVCSSDLRNGGSGFGHKRNIAQCVAMSAWKTVMDILEFNTPLYRRIEQFGTGVAFWRQIGRASCRERVCQYV